MLKNSVALPATDYQPSCASPTRSEEILLERLQALMVRLTSRRLVLANAKAKSPFASGYGPGCADYLTKIGHLGVQSMESGTGAGLLRTQRAGRRLVPAVAHQLGERVTRPIRHCLLLVHLEELKPTIQPPFRSQP